MKGLKREIDRAVRNGHYEKMDDGAILLPAQQLRIGGNFGNEVRHADGSMEEMEWSHNIVVDEGLNHVLDVTYTGATQIGTWYVGIYKGSYTPAADDAASNIVSRSTEVVATTDVDETARPAWVEVRTDQTLSNTASKVTYNIAGTITVYGAFLISLATMASTTGTLSSVSNFASSRSLVATDDLLVTYTITASDV